MPPGKALKRAIRRNGPDRGSQQHSAGVIACSQRPSSGQLLTRRNKYVLLEEREREQRRQKRMEAETQSGRGSGPGPQWMPAAAAGPAGTAGRGSPGSTKKAESRLRMTRVDGFNSIAGTSPRNSKDLPLAERACIPAKQIIDVLQSLSSTLIFNTANSEERLALASRLRHWVVEDGTYLIREGDGDRNRSAIFMIASGKATISLNRANAGGSVQEVDIKDIKSPNYFGEGRVLGDSRAYASVRAKEELVVYYIMRADIEELVSPTTRALMERDMHVRKFQKENLDDLFAVIRKNLSGMRCLARFAEEQRMGGEVGFFMEVEEYQQAETGGCDSESDEARKMQHAERIVSTYISPSAPGMPGLIYTSEAQRKAVAAKMKRLWGKDRPKRRRICRGSSNSCDGGSNVEKKAMDGDRIAMPAGDGSPEGREMGNASCDSGGDALRARRTETQPEVSSDKGSDAYSNANGDTCVTGEMGVQRPRSAPRFRENSSPTTKHGGEDSLGRHKADRRALSRSLFDEILDQNAIPTIRQNIVPKFIQSTYYELFLAELFPQVGVASAGTTGTESTTTRVVHLIRGSPLEGAEEEVDVERGERCGTSSLEDVNDDPEALAAKVSAAVEAARKV
ncbi:unnamed protein product, partial [Scytosiphon promiscuus]